MQRNFIKMGIIISSFIGCGREFLKNTQGDKIRIFDAVSDVEVDESNDESLESYYNIVMDNVSGNDIVFIGSSERIRKVFDDNNTDYDVFYPSKERRGEFIENQVRKRSNSKSIRELDANFNKWINEIEDDEHSNCYKHKLSNNGEFIGNTPIIMTYIDSVINARRQENNIGNSDTQ